MSQPWNFSFAFGEPESDSEDETNAAMMPQPSNATVKQQLSEDSRLAQDLDISTRHDTTVFKKTPFTIAKSNAALRSTRLNPAVNIEEQRRTPLVVTKDLEPQATNYPQREIRNPLTVVSNGVTDGILQSNNRRREQQGASLAPENPSNSFLKSHTTPKVARDTPLSEQKEDTLPPVLKQEWETPKRHSFVSPFKHSFQTLASNHMHYEQAAHSKVKELPMGIRSLQDLATPRKHVYTTPNRLPVKNELITPPLDRSMDAFRAFVPPASFTPVKRKLESSPTALSDLSLHVPKTPLSTTKRVRKYQPSSSTPVGIQLRSTPHRAQAVSAYSSGAFGKGSDEAWSTLPNKKKVPNKSMNNLTNNKLMTGVFKLPTLAMPKAAADMRRPKTTLLTLYQPPPPLASNRPDQEFENFAESASDSSEEGSSNSTRNKMNAIHLPKQSNHLGDVKSDFPCWEDDEDRFAAQEEYMREAPSWS